MKPHAGCLQYQTVLLSAALVLALAQGCRPRDSCGGLQGLACNPGEFCNFSEEATCGAADQTGLCEPVPQGCTTEYAPVCGCDGKTYSNACNANAQGVSVASRGECGGQAAVSCDRRELRCRRAEPVCPDMHVPQIIDGCFGPCVPIDSCACDEPEDCWNTDSYTCHMYKGRCGPYVN